MKAAIYARASTEKQGREQTVDSQLAALRRWATAHGHELKDDHLYIDEGIRSRPEWASDALQNKGRPHP